MTDEIEINDEGDWILRDVEDFTLESIDVAVNIEQEELMRQMAQQELRPNIVTDRGHYTIPRERQPITEIIRTEEDFRILAHRISIELNREDPDNVEQLAPELFEILNQFLRQDGLKIKVE